MGDTAFLGRSWLAGPPGASLRLIRDCGEIERLIATLLPKLHSARSRLECIPDGPSDVVMHSHDVNTRLARAAWVSRQHQWSTQMTHMIRACSVLTMAVLGLAVAAAPALAQNAPQCVVSGSPPAGWGFNSTGYIEIASGGSCMFSVNVAGEILSSSVSQNPAHGSLRQLNVSSFVYTSEAGYRGRDTFSVQAIGKSPTSSGRSVTTINATLQ